MEEKKILLLISSSPFSTLNNYEALRSSIALFDHKVSITWKDDGVYYILKSTNKTRTKSFLGLVEDLNIELYASEESLTNRGLSKEEIIDNVILLKRQGLLDLLSEAQLVMTF
jgi:tRNA 2-thiouridine synthesizing protein C